MTTEELAFALRSPLELCEREGCVHYRGEHKPACTAPGRGPDGIMVLGTRCGCQEFVPQEDA